MKYLLILLTLIMPAAAQTLPDAPRPQHNFLDKKNVTFMAMSAATISLDGWTTRRDTAMGRGEMNPIARPFVHSNGMSALYFGGSQAAVVSGMYFLHKTGHHRLERILPLAASGLEGFWVAHNLRLRPIVSPVLAPPPPDEHFVAR